MANKRITFKNITKAKSIDLKLNIPAGEANAVHFCASLCGIGDEIEIVE